MQVCQLMLLSDEVFGESCHHTASSALPRLACHLQEGEKSRLQMAELPSRAISLGYYLIVS